MTWWTTSEIKTLRRIYPVSSPSEIAKMLPRHTPHAIRARASRFGIRKSSKARGHNMRAIIPKFERDPRGRWRQRQ